ncbi:hypothetical protein LSH36_16g02055 [Paralvinella palmiformis]|uniref:Fucosyltransferase n=1 Tax=Paralvinella palmiformis TaxID=53620 RepID=A0AAD9NHI4_9ANNE|nr:hypothetical protein LSH36_16g02055 [Paralvinella palmiformis]
MKMPHLKVYNTIFFFSCITTGVYVFIWYVGIEPYNTPFEESLNITLHRPNVTGENHPSNGEQPLRATSQRPLERNRALNVSIGAEKTTKIIYIWDRPPWLFSTFGTTTRDFEDAGCPVYNCRLVDESTYTAADRSKADSILFTIRDFFEKDKPQRTSRDQIWVMWHNEAPLHDHPVRFEQLNDYFNLTFSYLDEPQTDIYRPMGRILPRPANIRYRPPGRSILNNKTSLVAWIVSNCRSKGQRNEYVNELSKYIGVDIYGRCGMNCSRENDYCFKMVTRDYKFYLSFESMYCEDYMTEKLWRPLSGFIVPVVLGGANYSAVLPRRSFIDVRDFNSPADLARYLKYLDANDDEYLAYFKWKEKYIAVSQSLPGLCDLCEILQTPSYPFKSKFRFDKYWDPDRYCKVGKDERLALHLE